VDYKNRFQNIFCNSDANEMTNMKRKREDLQVEKKETLKNLQEILQVIQEFHLRIKNLQMELKETEMNVLNSSLNKI
jgi:hypothetical protein